MKHWEEAALLTELLDRHAHRLMHDISGADWTLYLHIRPFLRVLTEEPILAALIREYVDEAGQASEQLVTYLKAIRRETATILSQNQESFANGQQQWGAATFEEVLASFGEDRCIDVEKCTAALQAISDWLSASVSSDELSRQFASSRQDCASWKVRGGHSKSPIQERLTRPWSGRAAISTTGRRRSTRLKMKPPESSIS